MPPFGEVNTPADQIIWREFCRKERDAASKAPGPQFSLRNAISREELPQRFKPGHLDPAGEDGHSLRGFDPKKIGWEDEKELTKEFRRCRVKALEHPAGRNLVPETSTQHQGWILGLKMRKDAATLKKSSSEPQLKLNDSAASDKPAKSSKLAKRAPPEAKEGGSQVSGEKKRGLGSWASESHLSSAAPTELSRLSAMRRAERDTQSALGAYESESRLSATLPSELCPSVAQASNVGRSELSAISSVPGVDQKVVRRIRAGDASVESALNEVRRYLCYGDKGNRYFKGLGESDATAYANKFVKATCGIPPHKWDPRDSKRALKED
mmetsp:Transcript_32949/g.60565  ORF Transcript_32949/g.60565 Transcript_32949/m.60565 type:complete len:325 (+) Transcript_32949:58-1032(+)